jgi:hypothetical protein
LEYKLKEANIRLEDHRLDRLHLEGLEDHKLLIG